MRPFRAWMLSAETRSLPLWVRQLEPVAFCLRQAETGTPVAEVCRKVGISEQTFYNWKARFGGMNVSEVRRLRQLEGVNRKLKQLWT